MIKVLFFEQVDSASGYYRIGIPQNEMGKQGLCNPRTLSGLKQMYGHDHRLFHKMNELSLKAADVIVVQMAARLEMEMFFKWANFTHVPILIEVDDLVDNPTSWINDITGNRAANHWLNRVHLWKQSDGFICSTEYLSKHYGDKFNKPAYTFINQLDFEDYRWNVEKDKQERVVIGFMGSASHAPDLGMIKEPIKRILDEYDVEFHFVGGTFSEFGFSDRIKFFTNKSTTDKVELQGEFFNSEDYPKHMAKWDIGIIPLLDEPFNKAKSDLKFLEYSRLKIPSVVSKLSTYRTVCDGSTGLLASNKEQWYRQLVKLIESEKRRLEIGQAAFEYVRDLRQIKQHAKNYVRILEKAIKLKGAKRQPGKLLIVKA